MDPNTSERIKMCIYCLTKNKELPSGVIGRGLELEEDKSVDEMQEIRQVDELITVKQLRGV